MAIFFSKSGSVYENRQKRHKKAERPLDFPVFAARFLRLRVFSAGQVLRKRQNKKAREMSLPLAFLF